MYDNELFVKITIYLDNNFQQEHQGYKMGWKEKEIYQNDILLILLKNLLLENFKDFYIKFCNHFNIINDYEVNQEYIDNELIDLKEKINYLNSIYLIS
jgi:hypothetical protein